MFFESYRLGEITSYMEQVEPILRNTDLVSIDMAGVQAADIVCLKGMSMVSQHVRSVPLVAMQGLALRQLYWGYSMYLLLSEVACL